jgi:hypothetical protein
MRCWIVFSLPIIVPITRKMLTLSRKVEYGYYNNLKLKNSTEFYWNPGYSIWYKGHDRYYSYYQDGLLSELNTYYWRDNDIYQKRKKEYSYNNKNLLIEEKITRISLNMVIPQSPNILSNMIISIALVCTLVLL